MFVDIVKTWQNSNDNLVCIYTCITAERSDVGDEVLSRGRYWHDKSMLAWLTVISTKSKHTQILTFQPYNNSRLITSAVRFYLPTEDPFRRICSQIERDVTSLFIIRVEFLAKLEHYSHILTNKLKVEIIKSIYSFFFEIFE